MRYDFGGLIFGEAYIWRGLFSEFYGILPAGNTLAKSLIIRNCGLTSKVGPNSARSFVRAKTARETKLELFVRIFLSAFRLITSKVQLFVIVL